jgi:tetratricopeptide (TPR) repeat protein
LELSGLSRAAVAELAQGAAVDAGELYERTAGNPFFVTEVLAAGQDSVPTTVRDAVLARAAPLSPQARAMLDAVAVVPQLAEMWLLDRLTQSPPGTVEECLRSGMLRAEAASVAFRHELARLAVEESLAPDLRLALHRRALAALMEPPIGVVDVARLAHHAVAAADPQAVLRFAPAAAEQAAAVGAHREAAALYREASRFAGGSSVDLRAALLAGDARESLHCDQNGQSIEAGAAALECYRQLGDPLKEGELLSLLSTALWCVGRVEESTQAGSEAIAALERCPPGRELAIAYAQRAGNRMTDSDHEGVMVWGGRAAELAERLGETEALVRALIYMGTTKLLVGDRDGTTTLERGIELAREARLDDRVGNAYVNLASVTSSTRAHALVDGRLKEGLEFCADRGLDQCRRYLLAYRARIELDQGRYDDAAESATLVLRESSPSVLLRILPQVVLATVRARRGDPDVKALVEDALRLAEPAGELQAIAPVAAARAEIAWLEGEREAIEAVTESALALAIERKASWEMGDWRAGVHGPESRLRPPLGRLSRTRCRSPATGRARLTSGTRSAAPTRRPWR